MHDNIIKMLLKCNVWWFDIIWAQTHPKNFAKTSTNLKNLKIFQKPQILGQKIWNAWLKDEKESYQREKQI